MGQSPTQTGSAQPWAGASVHGGRTPHVGRGHRCKHGDLQRGQWDSFKAFALSHPEELLAVWLAAPGLDITDLNLGPADYFIFREQNRTFQDIGLYMGSTVNITGSGEPEQASGLLVTDGLLPVLKVTPLIGRSFMQAA